MEPRPDPVSTIDQLGADTAGIRPVGKRIGLVLRSLGLHLDRCFSIITVMRSRVTDSV